MNDILLEVIHNTKANRFEIALDGQLAVLEYHKKEDVLMFTHTGVPSAFEGRGIGGRLARAGLEYAQAEGFKVVSVCSFVSAYIRRHPEYQPLVK